MRRWRKDEGKAVGRVVVATAGPKGEGAREWRAAAAVGGGAARYVDTYECRSGPLEVSRRGIVEDGEQIAFVCACVEARE